ncbi:MAG: hypothetical protein MJ211_10125 [Bacteroidales bacterium]|nr:hypothetical protein [Bacteroidales bacterium]
MNFEIITVFIAIITFIGATVSFCVKLGELKTMITKDIEGIKQDIKELERKDLSQDAQINKVQDSNNEIRTLLTEIKTQLEILMKITGVFDKK